HRPHRPLLSAYPPLFRSETPPSLSVVSVPAAAPSLVSVTSDAGAKPSPVTVTPESTSSDSSLEDGVTVDSGSYTGSGASPSSEAVHSWEAPRQATSPCPSRVLHSISPTAVPSALITPSTLNRAASSWVIHSWLNGSPASTAMSGPSEMMSGNTMAPAKQ